MHKGRKVRGLRSTINNDSRTILSPTHLCVSVCLPDQNASIVRNRSELKESCSSSLQIRNFPILNLDEVFPGIKYWYNW